MHGLEKSLVNDLATAKLINHFNQMMRQASFNMAKVDYNRATQSRHTDTHLTDRDKAGLDTLIYLFEYISFEEPVTLKQYFKALAYSAVRGGYEETAAEYTARYTKGITRAAKAFRKAAVA
jgi:hypothetical protein